MRTLVEPVQCLPEILMLPSTKDLGRNPFPRERSWKQERLALMGGHSNPHRIQPLDMDDHRIGHGLN